MLKDPTRRSNLGLEPNRRMLHYFTNPLGEDAKIAVQSLPKKIKKLKSEKPKKKAKKPKKKKRVPLPKSELNPDSHVKPTPFPSNKKKSNNLANAAKKPGKNARAKGQAAPIKREPLEIPDVAETLAKAAKLLVKMTTPPVNRNPRENGKVEGKADGKPKKYNLRKREKTNVAEVAQNQPLLRHHPGNSGNGMNSYMKGTCRSNPISIS